MAVACYVDTFPDPVAFIISLTLGAYSSCCLIGACASRRCLFEQPELITYIRSDCITYEFVCATIGLYCSLLWRWTVHVHMLSMYNAIVGRSCVCYVRRITSKREKSWPRIVDTMSESLERVEHIEVAKSGDFSETTTQYENVEQVEWQRAQRTQPIIKVSQLYMWNKLRIFQIQYHRTLKTTYATHTSLKATASPIKNQHNIIEVPNEIDVDVNPSVPGARDWRHIKPNLPWLSSDLSMKQDRQY